MSAPRSRLRTAARGLCATTVFMLAWIHLTPEALATFKSTTTASTTASAHLLDTPTLSCGTLGVLSARLNWTATPDASQADVYGSGFLSSGYELARGTNSGGPYTTITTTTATTYNDSLSNGQYYYVVRTVKNSWKGTVSNEVHVHALLFLVATCA